ncbi:hypothetical protein [Cumulibacter soli]|uniref:hypothetical protein n=1 Tax=Cumulibacter soli TaxID=2546344 RepID=UPI0010678191|nr:hypothetical protein [Cumulibacter soli]
MTGSGFDPNDRAPDQPTRDTDQFRSDGMGPTDPAAQRQYDDGDVESTRAIPAVPAYDDQPTTETATFPAGLLPADGRERPEDRFITGSTIDDSTAAPVPAEQGVAKRGFHIPAVGGWMLGILRIFVGWQFLWAFLDKTFGFGWSTPSESAWINGGSPTSGFLGVVVNDPNNPFASFFETFYGQTWADWLFMAGLLGIGIVLLVGLGTWLTWFASICGIVMYALMYLASWPAGHRAADGVSAATNPILDDHLLGAVLLLALALCNAGAYLGFAKAWRSHRAVRDI